ncbi:MAG: hypothetical protein M3Y27_24520 [Acidobacteriota bacterium]|nr:hypothetical protein [Acidobacteriota bacterium]
MTVIELNDTDAAALKAKAAAQGLTLEDWFKKLAATDTVAPDKSLLQFFRDSPLVGLEMEFERDRDAGRDIAL